MGGKKFVMVKTDDSVKKKVTEIRTVVHCGDGKEYQGRSQRKLKQ